MVYQEVTKGRFLSRPNRFIAQVELNGKVETVHVKNTGRCRELLLPGAVVYLEKSQSPNRKTGYSLIAVEKGERLINMDSQAPNRAALEAARAGQLPLGLIGEITGVRREVTIEDSRFDLIVETQKEQAVVEVKGVTLERDGAVFFPDAPTQRGVKHIQGLTRLAAMGEKCALLFVIQMEQADYFAPNWETHHAFGQALGEAAVAGVKLLAYPCQVTPCSMILDTCRPVEIRL